MVLPTDKASRLVVVWRITESCNASCSFCGYARDLNTKRKEVASDEVLKFAAVLAEYSRVTSREVLVSWMGGEPLIWGPFNEVSKTLHGELGLFLSVTTNGLMLSNKRIRESILDNYSEVVISIDGLDDFHDQVRGRRGLFKTIRDNMEALKDDPRSRSINFQVNTVLTRDNIERFEDLARIVRDIGFDSLTFNILGGVSRPMYFNEHYVTSKQFSNFTSQLPALKLRLLESGFRIKGGDRYLNRLSSSILGDAIEVHDCAPGDDFLFISEDGAVSPCSFTSSLYGRSLASLASVEDLISLPSIFRQSKRDTVSPSCKDCKCTRVFGKFE